MSLLDLLASAFSGGQTPSGPSAGQPAPNPYNGINVSGDGRLMFGQTAGAMGPGQANGPGAQASTPVSEVVATAKKGSQAPIPPPTPMAPPKSAPDIAPPMDTGAITNGAPQTDNGPSINYNNSSDALAGQSALAGEPAPRGGMANPGLYGLLPQGLQHGVLRNALGAVGDAFRGKPLYEEHMEGQAMGNALAGMDITNPDSVRAATTRLMQTGYPGALEMADKINQQAQQAALARATMENTQAYRTGILGERQQYHDEEAEARNQQVIRQRGQGYSGMATQATTLPQYKAIYDRANASAGQMKHPDGTPYTAEDMGLVPPDAWHPGAMTGFGQTGAQVVQSSDRRRGQDIGRLNSLGRDAAIRARPGPQQNSTGYLQTLIARNNGNGPPLNPDEKAYLTKATTSAHQGRGLPPGLTPGGGGAAPAAAGGFINGHVYRDAHGNTATYMNGKFIPH